MNEEKNTEFEKSIVLALSQSNKELDRLKDMLIATSDCFDDGEDVDGLQNITDHLIPGIDALASFCNTINVNLNEVLDDDLKESLNNIIQEFSKMMKTLEEETENGDLTEIGDILRFDFTDIIDSLKELFPQVKKQLETK